jgi:hypothetical protein
MWYSAPDSNVIRRIGYATSSDRVTWTKYAGNPVLDVGASGEWDDEGVINPMVVLEGNTYYLWYSGWDSTSTRIGYATSSDGIIWTKFSGNPVLDIGSTGSWDQAAVLGASVIFDGVTYHMCFEGGSIMPAGSSVPSDGRIGYATSPDRVTWTKYGGNPVLERGPLGSWDDRVVFGQVVKQGSIYHLWYSGFGGTPTRWKIGYAIDSTTSTGLVERDAQTPQDYSLGQNYPNPFNPSTTIDFSLPLKSRIRLAIFDVLGRSVAELANEEAEPGIYRQKWIPDVSSGIYFYRLEAVSLGDPLKQFTDVKKMLFLR